MQSSPFPPLSRTVGAAPVRPLGALSLATSLLAALTGCNSLPERPAYQVDCSPDLGVELKIPLEYDFEDTNPDDEEGPESNWVYFGDRTPGAIPSTEVTPVDNSLPYEVFPEGDRCGSRWSLHIRSYGHNDWGGGFLSWKWGGDPPDASAWEGIALWARTEENSDRSVTVLLQDRWGRAEARVADPETGALDVATCRPQPEPPESSCNVDQDGDGLVDRIQIPTIDPETNTPARDPVTGADLFTVLREGGDPVPTSQAGIKALCCSDATGSSGTVPATSTNADNDGDGKTNCEDPDCCGPETACNDGVDNDGDGNADCADLDCCGEATGCGCSDECAAELACQPNMTVARQEADGEVVFASVPRVVETAETAATQSIEGLVTLGTKVPDRYDCGNEFSQILTTTSRWQLYLLPFDAFIQVHRPNWSPAGLDPSALYGIGIRTPREAQLDLWIDDITFYRRVEE